MDLSNLPPLYQNRLVGSTQASSASTIATIQMELSRTKMSYYDKALKSYKHLFSDEYFNAYSKKLPLLPSDPTTWGFNIVQLFWSGVSNKYQTRLDTDHTYTIPNANTLITKNASITALRDLRDLLKKCHEEDTKLRDSINQITGSRHRNQQLQQPPNICNLTTPFQHPLAPNLLSYINPQVHKTKDPSK